jgi:hypothetical protein
MLQRAPRLRTMPPQLARRDVGTGAQAWRERSPVSDASSGKDCCTVCEWGSSQPGRHRCCGCPPLVELLALQQWCSRKQRQYCQTSL